LSAFSIAEYNASLFFCYNSNFHFGTMFREYILHPPLIIPLGTHITTRCTECLEVELRDVDKSINKKKKDSKRVLMDHGRTSNFYIFTILFTIYYLNLDNFIFAGALANLLGAPV
ncbi:hypothetical protein ACJX0J_019014, partial [Zea mays]